MDLAQKIDATDEPTMEVFHFSEDKSLKVAYEKRPEME
jgi:hypothetical protein